MDYLRFLDGSIDLATALPGSYDPFLVTISYLIAAFAAYAGLDFAGRISTKESRIGKWAWLAGGAVTMGSGVWAMHFIGMLAFILPIPVAYDPVVTGISVIPAILVGAVTLYVVSRDAATVPTIVIGGVCMGAGIGIMHYTGMAAMRMEAAMWYDPSLFALSVVVAVVLAVGALYIRLWVSRLASDANQWLFQVGSAAAMGLAITGMHYTAMQSTYIFPRGATTAVETALEPTLFGIVVAMIVGVIISLAVFGVWVDRIRMKLDDLVLVLKFPLVIVAAALLTALATGITAHTKFSTQLEVFAQEQLIALRESR